VRAFERRRTREKIERREGKHSVGKERKERKSRE
jgi:hypothetical protein